MQTVVRNVCDPVTKRIHEIQLPAPTEIKSAIPHLDFPPQGFKYRDMAAILAKKFQLSDEQINAKYKSQVEANSTETVWRDVLVFSAIRELFKEGQLGQPRGRGTPYVLAENIPIRDLNPDISSAPEELIKENYQKIRKELAAELLQEIKDNTPAFFEELVIDLLVAIGYGGSREDAGKAVGGSGDGGIDGIINEDRLGLDVVYIQAKRWENNVSAPPVRDFVGALQGKRARKGIFITTSKFSKSAQEYVEAIDSRDSKVILIDGNQLAQLMIDHNVGVSTVETYEIKRVDSDYFAENTE